MTTTAIEIDEELLNRCIVLSVDEDREQTRQIQRRQRESQTIGGLLAKQDSRTTTVLHQNAQRLLSPVLVANPYANKLTFSDIKTRMRRDHLKYLSLIRAIALLHQYQRPRKTIVHDGRTIEYIEATLADIATANHLAHQVLGRSLDELPPQTRKLLLLIHQFVTTRCKEIATTQEDLRFSRKDVRMYTNWGDTQLRVHLARLVELEYLLVHHGGRGQRFVYELIYKGEGQGSGPFLMNLIDVATLAPHDYDQKNAGLPDNRAGFGTGMAACLRVQNGVKTGGYRDDEIAAELAIPEHSAALADLFRESPISENGKNGRSYPQLHRSIGLLKRAEQLSVPSSQQREDPNPQLKTDHSSRYFHAN